VAAIQLQFTRLLDQVRVQLRYPHYNRKNDKTYLYRIRFLFAQAPLGSAAWGTRPREMEMIDGEAFLSVLAKGHKVRSARVRTHTFTAQLPHLRHLALVTSALQIRACSPC
jgi:hypothetical protein